MSLALASRRAAISPAWVKIPLWRTARAVPSLDLPFADTKSLADVVTGQSLVTFTRASSGTYVGSDGLIKTATTNLLLRSEEFDNTSWAKLNNVTVTANATTAPNGFITADKIVEPASSADKPIVQSVTLIANTTYTASVYFKAAERPAILFHVRKSDYSTRFGGFFNTSTNVFTTDTSGGGVLDSFTFTNVGGGWYRCSITGNIGANTAGIVTIYLANSSNNLTYTGDGTSGIYLWGAQLEQSSTVGEYIPTTSTINSAPRFDHNPTTGGSLGLLVEEQRTNLLLRSEEFDNASWVKTLATVTANVTTAPNGSVAADKLIGDPTIDSHYAQQNISGATNGISYTSSVYAKASEITRIEILHAVGATLYVQGYDLSSGTLLTRVTAGTTAATGGFIQAVGNGWYRCGITQTSDGTTGAVRVTLRSANTVNFDATSQGVLLWGAQLEAGAFPTSYIPTTTAAATRSADVASITGTAFSSWYRQDEGTVFAEGGPASPTLNKTQLLLAINDGSVNNRMYLGKKFDSTAAVEFGVASGGVGQAFILTTPNNVANARVAAGYKVDNFAVASSGGALATDTSGSVPVSSTQLLIGTLDNVSNNIGGTIRRLTFFPQRLPNSTLQAITQ